MPVDEKQIEEAAQLFEKMNDDTLEAVTEVWMKEALKRRPKNDTRKKTV